MSHSAADARLRNPSFVAGFLFTCDEDHCVWSGRDRQRLCREEFVAHVRARTAIDEIAPETLVLLTTKVHDNRAAAVAIVDRVRPDTIVLCVQNGLRSEQIVREIVGDHCVVLRAITQFGAIRKPTKHFTDYPATK